MKVRYFAWMKRTVGMADEEISPPPEVTNLQPVGLVTGAGTAIAEERPSVRPG